MATYATLVVACLVAFVPLLFVVATSVTNTYARVVDLGALMHPVDVNYAQAFFGTPLGEWTWNSLIVATVVTSIVLIIDSLAGYSFAKRRFAGRDVLFVLLLATVMVPAPVTLLPLFILVNRMGLNDSLPALVLPALAIPVGVFLMRQFIQTIPSELEDAARMDGMSGVMIYARVILPLSIPALASLGLFTFMTSWGALLWPVIITASDASRTLPAGLAGLPGQYNTDWGLVAAGTVMSMVPMLIAFLGFQRYLRAGIVGGRGGKG